MDAAPEEPDFVRELRARCAAEGGVLWIQPDELGVFAPEAARGFHACHFADLTLADKLSDVVRGQRSAPFSWKDIRAAWLTQLRRLSDGEGLRQLEERMVALLEARLGRPLDVMWTAHEVVTGSLLPVVVKALPAADLALVQRDQEFKLRRLLGVGGSRATRWEELRFVLGQVRSGNAVRRELRGRASGRRPRQADLMDPIVDLLPTLGVDRAVDAVTAVITAIAGPPGAAAASLLYELTHQPEQVARLVEELAPLSAADFHADPTRTAPATHRFVKEVLRMWGPPMFMTREAAGDLQVDETRLKKGQRFIVSPYLLHHDPKHWSAPDTFAPERWLPEAPHGACPRSSYVPFGWAPTACIGAGMGTAQLMLLCRLLLLRYRIQLKDPGAVRMRLAAVPMPVNFQGVLVPR
ncbi:cytochrome P450 family protein [Corallococcus coralloides]|uniref:Cytochrome P450 family protein n=1 Tax=Corallococcus coralloides TaxID=184914 RepID=A0A410RK17_CORCK|nr:cytochrome P450 [Corallococcus coralloides]QAT82267.1 cytochrome P450 family protein [Corallococcus coralloides]